MINPSAVRMTPEPSYDWLPASVCSATTLGSTFAATCSTEPADMSAAEWDATGAALCKALCGSWYGCTASARPPPTPADTTAIANPATISAAPPEQWRALEIGYRHIDTAEMYGNEKEVGQGVRDAGLDRADVFITSKLNNGFHKPDDARRAFDNTLRALESDHVDLFLIHWPLPTLYGGDFVSTWHVLEEFARDGRARSIGVSNFQPAHLDRLAKEAGTVPAVNQIEVHPYFANETVRAYGIEHGVVTEAWSPIAQGKVLDDAVIERIADSVGRTPAQVVLRWHIQRGDIVFPKSVSPDRMRANFELFDIELGGSDMDAISALDRGESGRTGPNPDVFDYVPG